MLNVVFFESIVLLDWCTQGYPVMSPVFQIDRLWTEWQLTAPQNVGCRLQEDSLRLADVRNLPNVLHRGPPFLHVGLTYSDASHRHLPLVMQFSSVLPSDGL